MVEEFDRNTESLLGYDGVEEVQPLAVCTLDEQRAELAADLELYLARCTNERRLDDKTVKAYRCDILQFIDWITERRLTFNREAMRRLAALRPALALFGHGPPLRDPDVLERVAGR